MAKKKEESLSAEEKVTRYQVYVAELKKGGRVPGWVCREVLDLGMNPSLDEVLVKVHSRLHHNSHDTAAEFQGKAVLAIMSASCLMREGLA